jgi:hypothetical protein
VYNLYLSLAKELETAGLNADIAHAQQQFFRGSSGKLLHMSPHCGRLRRASHIDTIICDPAVEDIPLCSACFKELPRIMENNRRLAHSLASMMREVQSVKNSTGWSAMATALTVRSNLEQLSTNDNINYWITELTTAIHDLDEILERLNATVKNEDAVKMACATAAVSLSPYYENKSLTSLGSVERYSSTRSLRNSIDAVWKAWSECVRDGRLQDAKQAADEALVGALGDTPEAFSMLPDVAQLDHTLFTSMKEWLKAEWQLKRDESLDYVIAGFEKQTEKTLAEHASNPDKVMVLQGSNSYRDSSLMYISNFDPVRASTVPGALVIKVPSVVFAYMSRTHVRVTQVCDALETDDSLVLQAAAQLYDPNNGEMGKMETVMQVARAMRS